MSTPRLQPPLPYLSLLALHQYFLTSPARPCSSMRRWPLDCCRRRPRTWYAPLSSAVRPCSHARHNAPLPSRNFASVYVILGRRQNKKRGGEAREKEGNSTLLSRPALLAARCASARARALRETSHAFLSVSSLVDINGYFMNYPINSIEINIVTTEYSYFYFKIKIARNVNYFV